MHVLCVFLRPKNFLMVTFFVCFLLWAQYVDRVCFRGVEIRCVLLCVLSLLVMWSDAFVCVLSLLVKSSDAFLFPLFHCWCCDQMRLFRVLSLLVLWSDVFVSRSFIADVVIRCVCFAFSRCWWSHLMRFSLRSFIVGVVIWCVHLCGLSLLALWSDAFVLHYFIVGEVIRCVFLCVFFIASERKSRVDFLVLTQKSCVDVLVSVDKEVLCWFSGVDTDVLCWFSSADTEVLCWFPSQCWHGSLVLIFWCWHSSWCLLFVDDWCCDQARFFRRFVCVSTLRLAEFIVLMVRCHLSLEKLYLICLSVNVQCHLSWENAYLVSLRTKLLDAQCSFKSALYQMLWAVAAVDWTVCLVLQCVFSPSFDGKFTSKNKTFVATKMILVAAPANDRRTGGKAV